MRKKRNLTNRQREILKFIEHFIRRNSYPPTVREIGSACGLSSPRSVSRHLQVLEEEGYIRRGKDKSRAIGLLGSAGISANHLVSLPLLGEVPAGPPNLAEENLEASYVVDESLFGGGEVFLLRVKGESMTGTHIIEGDILVVRPGPDARNGDIVVALIGEDATVKRYVKKGRSIHLVPDNEEMEPITLEETHANGRILGRVVGLIRRI